MNRTAIITGASSGIGEACARKLVVSGHRVIGNARIASGLAQLEKELGPNFRAVCGDAADPEVQDMLFAKAEEWFGDKADIIIANAGRGLGGAVSTAALDEFEEVLRVNVVAALSLMQKAAIHLEARLSERPFPEYAADIIVIGSVVGRNVSPFSAVYGSTKFAVHSLAEGLRRELAPKGIRVSLVEPGFVVSGFQDGAGYSAEMVEGLHRKFGPALYGKDIAEAVDFIISRPPHVHCGDIVIRPTRQEYP
ncbi:MAG: SDR family oxidoreductase [Spirochaetales bacterium]|nr:SDR family oxidoreductase [Spirochaetales bacterium]